MNTASQSNAAPSQTDEPTTTENVHAQQNKERRKRFWCVVRIVDYRLQALSPSDADYPEADQEWSDLGGETTVSADREAMFQLARNEQGLLMSTDGLPGAGRVAAFAAKIKAKRDA